MKKLAVVVALSLCMTSCAHCPLSSSDRYAIARRVIQGAQLALGIADGVLAALGAAPNASSMYTQIRAAVNSGLRVALDAVDAAEDQGQGFDLKKLLVSAEASWQDLRTFLTDLQATQRGVATAMPHGRRAYTVADLPRTLLP